MDSFQANATQSNDTNKITWETTAGNAASSGSAYLQAFFNDIATSQITLVLKDVQGEINYDTTSTVVSSLNLMVLMFN